VFHFVLDFMRGRPIPWDVMSDLKKKLLREDLEYYQLNSTVNREVVVSVIEESDDGVGFSFFDS